MPAEKTDLPRPDATIRPGLASPTGCWSGIPAVLRRVLGRPPPGVWARVLMLFGALSLIKVGLLVRMSKHLFEIHWRVAAPEITPVGRIAFYGFVGLGVLSLAALGKQCRVVGARAVRAANVGVLGLGLLFILLTFHSAEKNYLYPILAGILNWSSLVPYLSLDLFFHPPYLAAWLAAYAFLYYALARSGRETWVIYLTAGFAGLYGFFCLRELAAYENELLVADCLGLVSLVFLRSPAKKLRLAWLLAPAVWSLLFAFELFHRAGLEFGPSVAYFTTLLGGGIVLFGGLTLLAKKRGFVQPWACLVLFYAASFLLLADANYPVATNYNRALCLGLELPRYFAGEFFVAAMLALGASVFCRLSPKGRLWWLDILNLALIAIALLDFRLSQIMGVQLDWDVLALGNSPKMIWRMARPYLPGILAAFGAAVLIYAAGLRAVQAWVRRTIAWRTANPPGKGAAYVAATAILLGLLGLIVANPDKAEGQAGVRLAQTNPLWKRLTNRTLNREEFLQTASELGLGNFEAPRRVDPEKPPRDLNVLLVFMESSYNQYLSLFSGTEETQPLLSKYKNRMELFPNFFSNFASSIHARFATFTSLYPIQDYNAFTLHRVGVKSLFEVLHERGYTCSLFYSSFADFTGFRDFLKPRQLDEMYDADTMPGQRTTEPVSWGLREEETLGAIRTRIKKYAQGGQRFFLTYVPAAPHYPYEKVPEAFHKFKVAEMDDYTPLYLNELLYMDWVLASIVDQLKESGLLDKTLVVITDDHGEMLGANKGPIGHGWLLTPELANAPLIIMDPQKPGCHINPAIGSQIDLLPSVLDLLNIPLPADQLYEGRSLYGPQDGPGRMVYLSSYQQYGIIDGNRFLLGDREAEQGKRAACKAAVYGISNQGTKTVFTEELGGPGRAVSIRRFDEFQEGLLRNYSLYSESIRRDRAMARGR